MRKLSFLFMITYFGLAAVLHYLTMDQASRQPDVLPIFAETLGLIVAGVASSLGLLSNGLRSLTWLRSFGIVLLSLVIWVILYALGDPKYQHGDLSSAEMNELMVAWTILIVSVALVAVMMFAPTWQRKPQQPQVAQ